MNNEAAAALGIQKMTRMVQFAELFPDKKIVATLSQQLSWSHFVEILPIENEEARRTQPKSAVFEKSRIYSFSPCCFNNFHA